MKDRTNSRNWRLRHPERYKQRMQAWYKLNRQKYRRAVIEHYGGGSTPKCACCGETLFEFLTIDHINGGGNQFKIKTGIKGDGLYRWLIKNNYPKGYRVLCMNCNHSYGHYGYCPHQYISKSETENDGFIGFKNRFANHNKQPADKPK